MNQNSNVDINCDVSSWKKNNGKGGKYTFYCTHEWHYFNIMSLGNGHILLKVFC